MVSAEVYPLLRQCRSSGCNKKYRRFSEFITKESYKINHKFDRGSKCIIYLFSCKICRLQYVGSTVERFRFRWNNYKFGQRGAAQGATPPHSFLHQRFLSEGHHV